MDEFISKYWLVYREDETGNKFLIRGKFDLTEQSADDVILDFAARGHKQTYFKISYDAGKVGHAISENNIRFG